MILAHNSILHVKAKVNNGKDNEIKINKDINDNSQKREEKLDKFLETSSLYIGFDLGTTTLCIGIMNDNNKIEILLNRGNGSRLIKSVFVLQIKLHMLEIQLYIQEYILNLQYMKVKD